MPIESDALVLSGVISRPMGQAHTERIALSDVPFHGRSDPVQGLTLNFGRYLTPARDLLAQKAQGQRQAALVSVRIKDGGLEQSRFMPLDELGWEGVLVLPRVPVKTSAMLVGLIQEDVDRAVEAGGTPELAGAELRKLVAVYPHLLDALARHKRLAHLRAFVWSDSQMVKLGTIYSPHSVSTIHAIDIAGVEAVLPDHLADNPDKRRAPFDLGHLRAA